MTDDMLIFGRDILHDEARALDALADSLGDAFGRAVALILGGSGKLIVGGLGKSGHVGRKIAATFASTGTTAALATTSPARALMFDVSGRAAPAAHAVRKPSAAGET